MSRLHFSLKLARTRPNPCLLKEITCRQAKMSEVNVNPTAFPPRKTHANEIQTFSTGVSTTDEDPWGSIGQTSLLTLTS